MDESQSTGERLLTGYLDRYSIEHLHRYAIAQQCAGGKDVLDIACGEGYGSNLLADVARTCVGVDIDPLIIGHARKKYTKDNLSFLTGSASAIPLEHDSVDIVVSFETLEHHDKHDEMYWEIKRVLRPDGFLIISTPDKKFFSDKTGHQNEYHVKELYLEEFVELNKKYFSHVRLASQKTVLGSLVVSDSVGGRLFLYEGDHHVVADRSAFAEPTYHICLASDVGAPAIGSSLFDAPRLLSGIDSELEDKVEEIDKLNSRVAGLTKVISDLRNSPSYRLGRRLLQPFSWMKRSRQ